MSLAEIRNITAGYDKENVLENVSFDINCGELVGVLGANGSGKSTLVKAVSNLLPHNGNVVVGEKTIENLKPYETAGIISYIPQHSGLNIDISVLDVVLMGFNSKLKILENPGREMLERAKATIELVGLKDKAESNYLTLSEGQKQLVILARALVSDGKLLVMDEPESALDFNVRYKIMSLVKKQIQGENRAGLLVLHDTTLALNNCDRLILLKDKKIVGIIDLHNDTIESAEEKLSLIYGEISLVKTAGKTGRESLIMICDSEGV
ncbi:MAG: ABC transporter ATP-binding protein [Lachnospiraceae bacterium]|nr:ABC transporter ATP-binding protein [Lachnospiraceae bacterium]